MKNRTFVETLFYIVGYLTLTQYYKKIVIFFTVVAFPMR